MRLERALAQTKVTEMVLHEIHSLRNACQHKMLGYTHG